jgi:broad specificity phosphatase PhoE
MASILIARHGPVALAKPQFPTRAEFAAYVAAYEQSGLRAGALPGEDLRRRVRQAALVFTSPAPRAQQSLKLIAPERRPIVDAVFGEEPQMIPRIGGRWPLLAWFALARGAGAFHPQAAESRRIMRARAQRAADLLTAASANGDVALIGHGWFNRAIVGALAESDWRRAAAGREAALGRVSAEWGYAIYTASA